MPTRQAYGKMCFMSLSDLHLLAALQTSPHVLYAVNLRKKFRPQEGLSKLDPFQGFFSFFFSRPKTLRRYVHFAYYGT